MEEEKKVVEATTTEKEGSKFGWGVLGFFFPLVGLILFLVWLKDKKKAAKAAGIGALIGFILNVIVTVLAFTGVISIFTLAGEPVIDVKTNTNTVEKKKDDKTTTEEVKKEENKKEESKSDSKVEPVSEACTYKATKGEKDYLYNFNYDETCETNNIIDENNNILFKIQNNKIVLNNGESFDYFDKSFYKTGNSVVVYSTLCSPGYCYIYVNNIKDKTGFKIDSSIENGKMINPYIKAIGIDRENNFRINILYNESASMESVLNDSRAIVIMKVRACEVSDIDATLAEYNLDNFAMKKSITYGIENGTIKNNPKEEITQTIKDYNEYIDSSICSVHKKTNN